MFVNIDAFLPRLFELLENPLRAIKLRRLTLDFHPAFASRDLDPKRILQRLQELEVVGVERLKSARALKLQGARFSHLGAGAIPARVKCIARNDGNRKRAPNASALPAILRYPR